MESVAWCWQMVRHDLGDVIGIARLAQDDERVR